MQNASDYSGLLAEVESIVREAGIRIRNDAARPRDVRHKGRIDLVTGTDLAVEDFLKKKLESILPEAAFLAEETESGTALDGLTWIIDPVDGTTNFAHDLPHVATSVGLWDGDRVVLGVVNAPLLGECYSALAGKGAWCDGRNLAASTTDRLEDALVATGFPYRMEGRLEIILERLNLVLPACQGVRRLGSAALDLCYVAAGRFDAYYESWLNPWDVAAGWLVVCEAGGLVSRINGDPFGLDHDDLLAAGRDIHPHMLRLLETPDA